MIKDRSCSQRTPYDLLAVQFDAPKDAITNDILGKALLIHGPKAARELNEAFAALRDPMKRMETDFFFYPEEEATRLQLMKESYSVGVAESNPRLRIPKIVAYDEAFRNKR